MDPPDSKVIQIAADGWRKSRLSSLSSAVELVDIASLRENLKPPPWILKPLLHHEELAVLFGPPASCKSALALAMAVSVATGESFLGLRPTSAPVVYLAGEGQRGLALRERAIALHHGTVVPEKRLFISTGTPQFLDEVSFSELEAALDEVAELHGKPSLVIVDTLARCLGPGDESLAGDMGRFVAACDILRKRFNAAVLVIHHAGLMAKDRARGSSALRAAADVEMKVEIKQGNFVELTTTKSKDAEPSAPLWFRRVVVDLEELDEDGDPVSSVTVEQASEYQPVPRTVALGNNQRIMLETLTDLISARRQESGDEDGFDDARPVSLAAWRSAAQRRLELAPDSFRRAFYQARRGLEERGLIVVSGDGVRLIK